jgi:SAM-dependent methyltransferase
MELFGEALYAYLSGDKSKLILIESGKEFNLPQRKYFRDYNQLTRLEKKIISLCRGNILDVGCATGYYFPALMKKGTVEGIDISGKAIEAAKETGLKNCKVKNIFKFHTAKKYDTITLFQNNLGMAGSLPKARRLLEILSGLLKKDGQILLVQRKLRQPYHINYFRFKWKGRISQKVRWIYINIAFLSRLCEERGLLLERIDRDRQHHLIRLTRKSSS